MARPELSPAEVILLAVHFTGKSDITALRTLVSLYRKTLHTELLLRILLSHLPESLDPSEYVPFIEEIVAGPVVVEEKVTIDSSPLDATSDEVAKKKVRKLHLLPLASPAAPQDVPAEPLVQFLIHRALRIDEFTGIITQIPELLAPFLGHSPYLRTWLISTILPLLRLNYQYHPDETINITIPKFDTLDDKAGVSLLLSKTGNDEAGHDPTAGRDLRGLVAPWIYGDTRWKRRRARRKSMADLLPVTPPDEEPPMQEKYAVWGEVFKWVANHAEESWKTIVEMVEQWDGPGDADLGGYEDGNMWLAEDDQQYLERQYARCVLATAYLIPKGSKEELEAVQRVLVRLVALADKDRIPTLEVACALLSPVSGLESDIVSPKNAKYLRTGFLDEDNVLTLPKESSIKLLHALLVSAFLCTRIGLATSIRRAGELAFMQDRYQQEVQFTTFLSLIKVGHKDEDKHWARLRNEILWLRSWGAEELQNAETTGSGPGIFGQLPKDFIEVEILKTLLSNARYALAKSIYETSPDAPLANETLHSAVIAAAMNQYDNATNANRTRGAVKKCNDILEAFPKTLAGTKDLNEIEHLLQLTHNIGPYRLVLKRGEPFKPVSLRIHEDPISLLGKILEQNPESYTKIGDFVEMGRDMVLAGLTDKSVLGKSRDEQLVIANRQVISLCVDAALSEDDFETAYSYISTRLKDSGGPATGRSPPVEHSPAGLCAEAPPKIIDDWSWRAALQAGKYRRTAQTLKPTHLGNAPANPDIRHLEQRMDCLSHALRLAPRGTLQEILNVYRRCEEELESLVKQESEREDAWDAQGDEKLMPGGFAATPAKKNVNHSSMRGNEEAPMSLFDLSRASVARAQSGFSALSMLRAGPQKSKVAFVRDSPEGSMTGSTESLGKKPSVRKRDQLKNVAVGGLASGVGWLLGAQPVQQRSDSEDEELDDRR